MMKAARLVQSGDSVKEEVTLPGAARTDKILMELNHLYVERCKALQEKKSSTVAFFNRQIADLKAKLTKI